jgi:hypothetical protein
LFVDSPFPSYEFVVLEDDLVAVGAVPCCFGRFFERAFDGVDFGGDRRGHGRGESGRGGEEGREERGEKHFWLLVGVSGC